MIELLAITPPEGCPSSALPELWTAAGVHRAGFAVLLRSPGRTPRQLLAQFGPWIDVCRQYSISTLLSADLHNGADALHIAAQEGLAGLHLRGDPSPSALEPLRAAAPRLIFGRSCHGRRSDETHASVDYTCIAPIFPPQSRESRGKTAVGLSTLSAWCTEGRWIVALGGVSPENATSCFRSGARGVASIASFLGTRQQVTENVRRLVEIVEAERHVSFTRPRH